MLNFITLNHVQQLLLHTFLDLSEKYDGCHLTLKKHIFHKIGGFCHLAILFFWKIHKFLR